MPVNVIRVESWHELRESFGRYAKLPYERQRQYIFRGQADNSWYLRSTLDRSEAFADDEQRREYRDQLLIEFRRLAVGLGIGVPAKQAASDWELLARHHGLPMPIMDWTTSPYIASYFAFEEEPAPTVSHAAIWVLDRDVLLENPLPELQLLDDEDIVGVIPRAIEQRAVFLRIDSVQRTIEQMLGDALYVFEVPRAEREVVLSDLDASLVNARTLFRDLDSAARTAVARVLRRETRDDAV